MAEYIDREALIEQVKAIHKAVDTSNINISYDAGFHSATSQIQGLIAWMPAADVAEVKHGEWLRTDAYPHKVFCSLCYRTYVTNEEVIQERNSQHPCYCTEAEYCPHCGAKMDGKENDHE